MNLGRFNAAIHFLKKEFEQNNTSHLLSQLQTVLQQSISSPSEATAQAFKDSYAKIVSVFNDAPSNTAFPTRRKIYDEIGAIGFIGSGLVKKIETIFSENQITPANALAELQKVAQQTDQFIKRVRVLDDTFVALQLEFDDLEPGQFEIGLSLPRVVVGGDIESLEKEFHEVNFALKTLQEVVGAGAGGISVKSISASEWQIYLESIPLLAAGLAHAIERIVTLYKNNLEIKKLKRDLEERKLPDAVLKPLQDHIEATVKTEIRKIADDLVDQFYKVKDEGRKNELKNQTSQALRYLADRIDRGATIEVHAEPPIDKTEEAVEGNSGKGKPGGAKDVDEIRNLVNIVNEKMSSIIQLTRSDQPVLAIEYDKNKGSKGSSTPIPPEQDSK